MTTLPILVGQCETLLNSCRRQERVAALLLLYDYEVAHQFKYSQRLCGRAVIESNHRVLAKICILWNAKRQKAKPLHYVTCNVAINY